ncbi:hypothetical protein QBC47DRAFT_392100 [Echria macrotheca]|uniref:Uncharacterized protein n=1 Tax=Echria macrotheca TaxID=438768 RepID=A0AAJ0B3I6_9PEZI|nr:hypothetical protein QBC47DRAFT_392100 [Echria macrotheca]
MAPGLLKLIVIATWASQPILIEAAPWNKFLHETLAPSPLHVKNGDGIAPPWRDMKDKFVGRHAILDTTPRDAAPRDSTHVAGTKNTLLRRGVITTPPKGFNPVMVGRTFESTLAARSKGILDGLLSKYPQPGRDVNGKPPPFPLPVEEAVGMDKIGMPATRGNPRRGRMMAQSIAHHDPRHGQPKKEHTEKETAKHEHETKDEAQKQVPDTKEEDDGTISEKKMIDELEHKLCSPSCLREAIPGPESGRQWTNGKKKTLPVVPPNRLWAAS